MQNFPNDIITLTIRKTDKEWDSNQKFSNYNYIEPSSPSINSSVKSDCNYIFKPQPKPQWEERIQNNGSNSNKYEICTENMFEIDLTKSEEGPLGLTVAGSEDATQPIIVSGLIKGIQIKFNWKW